ncbi:MAG: peptide ABC transporter substrate-binding protein [Anaerolineales bacterium]
MKSPFHSFSPSAPFILFLLFLFFPFLLTACNPTGEPPTPEAPTTPAEETPAESPTLPAEVTAPPPATPTPEPRTLTLCLGAQPDSLYLYGSTMHTQRNVLEAIYDGPFDTNSYGYQPVILTKIPSLAEGDALLQPITVREGDLVVDADGNVTPLTPGLTIRPAGCQKLDCASPFPGGETQMDQLSVTFTLLADLKWSDGAPLTANDSVYSYQLDADPATPTPKFRIERTASYTALDDRTVQWVGLPGFLDATYQTNFWTPLPQHAWGTTPAADLLEADLSARQPMGWGPYIITEWQIGNAIHLKKNPHYFRAAEGLPRFDHLIIRFIGIGETNANTLLEGACDVLDIEAVQSVSFTEWFNLDQDGQLQAYFTPLATWEHADFGLIPASYDDGYQVGVDRPDLFGDARTRRAIAFCMDRQQINQTLYLGFSEIPATYLPSSHPLFNPNAPQYPFDPAAGMALLDEVGWRDTDNNPATPRVAQAISNVPDGTPLAFTYLTTPSAARQQTAQILLDSLAQCGIQLTIQALDIAELYAEGPAGPVFGRQFDMAHLAWLTGAVPPCDLYLTEQIPGEDVTRFPYRWGGTNLTGYSNPAYDAACQNALALLPGQPGYLEAHHLAQQIFAEDLPVIPLHFRLWATASRPDFCGHTMDPTAKSDFWNLEMYNYGPACNQ